MPIQLPALSQDQWNQRRYDLQLGSLYPINFTFVWNQTTNPGLSGDGGVFNYLVGQYTIPNFSGLALVTANFDPQITPPVIAQVSLNATPTYVDSAVQPVDSGNILFNEILWSGGANNQKGIHKNFYPGIYPLATGQIMYCYMISYANTLTAQLNATLTLHLLQTGLAL